MIGWTCVAGAVVGTALATLCSPPGWTGAGFLVQN